MRRLMRRAATATAATALLLGGGAMAASPASAVGSCTKEMADYTGWASTTVNLRSGPGTGYASLGLLQEDTKLTVRCWRSNTWAYVQVRSGANAGKYGWVSLRYIAVQMNPS
ncbi:SH3 domain-containing protein [Streptomyces sp. NPDC054841]